MRFQALCKCSEAVSIWSFGCPYDIIMLRCLLVCFALPILGQTLKLGSVSTAVGQDGKAAIWLADSSRGTQTVALQWDLYLPAEIQSHGKDLVAGDAARAASKSVTCARIERTTKGEAYRCILAGGQLTIRDGVIAIIGFTVNQGVRPGRYPMSLENVLAVGRSTTKRQLKGVATTLIIKH